MSYTKHLSSGWVPEQKTRTKLFTSTVTCLIYLPCSCNLLKFSLVYKKCKNKDNYSASTVQKKLFKLVPRKIKDQ